MDKNNLKQVRKKIDQLDHKILNLIEKRTNLVKKVIKLKKFKKDIIDKKRIKKILNTIKEKSIKRKLDPTVTNRIWKSMIKSFIYLEKKNFKKYKK